MIALVARDGGDRYAGQKECHANYVCWPQLKKVMHAFEQAIDYINGTVECEDDEKRAMVCVKVCFVIDRFVNGAFAWKKQERGKI